MARCPDLGKEVDANSRLVHVVEAVVHEPRNQSRFADYDAELAHPTGRRIHGT